MNELSLFTGIGGGLLGTKLLSWRHIGYVEINEYCQKVLRQRIKDGILDDAPIFGDIREFNRIYAKEFKGVADVITAGFPCQPFSVAGKRQGADDERNMWPATIECIRTVRPRYALLENVPGLLTSGYFGTILRDLAESGYDIRWRCLSAAEVGANHKRNRLWILADSGGTGVHGRSSRCRGSEKTRTCNQPIGSDANEINVADTKCISSERKESQNRQGRGTLLRRENVADPNKLGCELCRSRARQGKVSASRNGSTARDKNGKGSESWWTTEPDLGRLAYGVPNRVDRLKAIGNAQVPAVVRAVWELLND